MKHVIKDTIEEGDLVSVRGEVYVAAKKAKGRACDIQCDMFDPEADRCLGVCFRWPNAAVRFKRVGWYNEQRATAVCVETPMWRDHERKMADEERARAKAAAYAANGREPGDEPRKRGVKPRGCVSFATCSWQARIIIDGTTYTKRHATEEEAWAWLDEVKREHGILAELDKMKEGGR